jgi:membrane protein implicated in regulation of membrane protease activity
MLTFYLIALLVGGLLVAASLFSGGDADVDADVDVDVDADADADVDADADGDADAGPAHVAPAFDVDGLSAWMPIRSVRFWTFFLAFGGLLGTLLTLFDLLPALPIAVISGAVGYASGIGISTVVRRLRTEDVSSGVSESDYVGATGTVLLPVAPGQVGKVRVELKGRAVDAAAVTDDPDALAERSEVLVYEVRDDGVLLVTANANATSNQRRVS